MSESTAAPAASTTEAAAPPATSTTEAAPPAAATAVAPPAAATTEAAPPAPTPTTEEAASAPAPAPAAPAPAPAPPPEPAATEAAEAATPAPAAPPTERTAYETTLEAFKAFDTDGKGFVSAAALKEILGRSSTGTSLTEAQCEEMIQNMLESGLDTDGDGKLSFEELAAWWADQPSKREYSDYEKKLMGEDADGDGFISVDELMGILNKGNKRPLTLEQVQGVYNNMLKTIDANGDGKLSIKEVADFFQKQAGKA